MAQVHKAGAGSSCSNEIAGHNELEEFSQRNSFAYFCFGFLCECFFSALVDGFQTEGTLGNEREKAVTHCTRCQGMAVTHGSWRGPCAHLARAAAWSHPPRDPASSPALLRGATLHGTLRPRPGCPSSPTAALGRCLPAPAAASLLTSEAGDDHLLLHTSHRGDTGRGHAKRTGGRVCGVSRNLPVTGRKGDGRRAVWTWQLHSTVCSQGRRHVAENSIVLKRSGRPGHAESGARGVTGPHCHLRGSIPSAVPYELLPAVTARCSWK